MTTAPARRRPAVLARNLTREVARGVTTVDRGALRPGEATRVALGVAIPLALGLLLGFPLIGAASAAGALSVGFVAMQGTYRGKLVATVVASVGMGLSTVLGAVVDGRPVLAVLATALLGLGAGLAVSLGAPATVTGIQCVIALLVVSQFQLTPGEASLRAVEVLAGGLLQALLVVLPWPLRRAPAERAALSRLYLSLAAYGRLDATTPPDPGALAAAAAVLADPQPFARDADLGGYGDLLAEGDRIRTSFATLATARTRVAGTEVAAALEVVGAASGVVLRLLAAAVREDTEPHRPSLEAALRAAGRGATAVRDAGAAHYVAAQVDALLGQLRAARRITERLVAHAASGPARRAHRPPVRVVGDALMTVRANLGLRSASFRHALRLAGGLGLASTVAHATSSPHGYWLTLTVLVVLRPDFGATVTRGVARVIGTLLGAGLATAVAALLQPSRPVLAILSVAVAFLGYLLFQVNYATYAACITSYIAFFLAFAGLPEASVAAERAIFTLGGGLLALLAYSVWPTWESTRLPDLLGRLLRAQGAYVADLLDSWAEPAAGSVERRKELRGRARLARSNAEASLARVLAEPHRSREIDPDAALAVTAGARRIALAALALHAARPDPDAGPAPAGTAELGRAVAVALDGLALRIEGGDTVDTSGLRPLQVALAARLGVGGGASALPTADPDQGPTRRTPDLGSAELGVVPLLVVETDALVDAVGTITAALHPDETLAP